MTDTLAVGGNNEIKNYNDLAKYLCAFNNYKAVLPSTSSTI